MITHLQAKEFGAVPYLEGSSLMQAHPKGVRFSTSKPNVIVGENGAGKSAIMRAMALQTLSFYTGTSAFDKSYLTSNEAKDYWRTDCQWRHEYTYLPGLTVKSDRAPALYYRPGQIPGGECSITHAMMTGYFDEARAYADLTENKSSGQQGRALLGEILAVLSGQAAVPAIGYANWNFGKEIKKLANGSNQFHGYYDYQAEILKEQYQPQEGALPLVLMDEPEQSLDAKSAAMLWQHIAQTDCSKVQVIVASHSWYPFLHPEQFNLIEATPGYLDETRLLLGQQAAIAAA